jgi:molybdate-binding protein
LFAALLMGLNFFKLILNRFDMAKAKKKSAKEASKTFHDIMKASVKGNPKPKPKTKNKKAGG